MLVLSLFHVSKSLSLCNIQSISLTSLLLSVLLQTSFLPCVPITIFLPSPFSTPTSVSSVSWLLWWGTEYLFLVRNLHEGVMTYHHFCPFVSVFLSDFLWFLHICFASTSFLPSHLCTKHCSVSSFLLTGSASSNAFSLDHLLLGFDVFCNLRPDA